MTKSAPAVLACACSLALALFGGGCTTTACAVEGNGNYVCDGYLGAYPYDYAYVDPLYVGAGGYYPYTVDTYYDPIGYDAFVYDARVAGPIPIIDPVPRSNVPELLDKARRAANSINAGVRAALAPIRELIRTPPRQSGETIVYGPADHGTGSYQFLLRRLSESEQRFGWRLEARPSGSGASFAQVAGGLIRVGDVPRRGHGVLGVDCSALAAADDSVSCRGTLMIGFAHPSDGDKILSIGLRGYTADANASPPIDGSAFAWRQGDAANHVRLIKRTNLSGTATSAEETVAIKLTWLRDVGVRADAVATGGDIAPGQATVISTCLAADLQTPSCPSGLETIDLPNPDPTAIDPPIGAPETPAIPTTMP